jgi:asparagine synthase (glutamine-hydrolysing)
MFLDNSIDLECIEKKFIQKFRSYFDEISEESYYNKLMYAFEKVHLVGLLQRVDNATMAASVEARVPFVDHRLVEFAFTIPMKYKLKWNNESDEFKAKLIMSDQISEVYDIPKYILKKAFENDLPEEVLYRKKVGFPVPLNNWFGGHFNDYARKILLSNEAIGRSLYHSDNIKNCLNDASLIDNHENAMKIWMLVNLELFISKYFDKQEEK